VLAASAARPVVRPAVLRCSARCARSRPAWRKTPRTSKPCAGSAKARDYFARYLEVRPNDVDVMTDLGVTYRELGQFDRALDLFQQAHRLAPEHWQSLYNTVVVLGFNLKKYPDAQAALEELRKMQPNNADVERLATELDKQRKAAA